MPYTKHYLGDGAYYTHRNGEIEISAEDGIRTTNSVYLGPAEIARLLQNLGRDFDRKKLLAMLEQAP